MKDGSIVIKGLILPYIGKKIDIEFYKELNYLKGNNGCGKTLLLDYLSGLKKQKDAVIQGNESIIYINQNIFFPDRLLCIDFLKFVYRLDNRKRAKENFLNYVNSCEERKKEKFFENLLYKPWGMLSSGERKTLYTVVLLSLHREWYILDEPFAFVDEYGKNLLWKLIQRKAQEGKGIIITSHEEQNENFKEIHSICLDDL